MKRAVVFLCLALFILLVIQPNLYSKPEPSPIRVPDYTETAKTNDDLQNTAAASGSVIVIDPGRGGSDVGYDPEGSLSEKDISMQLAINIGNALSKAGYTVYYTRWYDDIAAYNSEQESDLARIDFARSVNADFMLSLRFYTGESLEKGFAIFTQPNNDELDALSKELAANIQSTNYSTYLGLDNDHYSNFSILSGRDVPTILLEMGFLTNSEDYSKITDSSFQAKLGSAVSQAFLNTVN